jgi:hypothetical protein
MGNAGGARKPGASRGCPRGDERVETHTQGSVAQETPRRAGLYAEATGLGLALAAIVRERRSLLGTVADHAEAWDALPPRWGLSGITAAPQVVWDRNADIARPKPMARSGRIAEMPFPRDATGMPAVGALSKLIHWPAA